MMSPALLALGVDKMSNAERIGLAQEILDVVAADQPRGPLPEAVRQMLADRLADHEANPDDVVPWETVRAEAMARIEKLSNDGVRQVSAAYDALAEPERHTLAVEILRRQPDGELSADALDARADEWFVALDAEEVGR